MTVSSVQGFILTPQGFVRGALHHDAGRITRVEGVTVSESEVRNGRDALPIVLPGFIDTHVHGGGGRDTMEAGDAIQSIARMHARHGTTSLLATTMTAPLEEIRAAMAALGPACKARVKNGARVLGVHLEGPYINPGKLGAQPDFAKPASIDEIQALNALAPIRVITMAPEMPGYLPLINELRAAGFVVQIGHTAGSYEEGVAALEQGARGFTHLFNAMTGLHHREPGMAGAALAHAQFAEVIPDLLHVHPGALRVALRSIPCLFCVTDSTSAAGMPDGEYRLGRHTVTKCMGGVRLPDGTLAGSTLTMDQALRNLVQQLGLEIEDASRRVSTYAADYMGVQDRGRLGAGAWADLAIVDRDLKLQRIFVEGEEIELGD
ncbi:MAG: N-acetylglucosamine-6-phosphate deacetylase [Paucibacter sp.]|nr:N-acetylglucosamine-6-phosphate deacetylase [Roseateles sp.]